MGEVWEKLWLGEGKAGPNWARERLEKEWLWDVDAKFCFCYFLPPHRRQHLPKSKNSALVNEGNRAMPMFGVKQNRIKKGNCSTCKVWPWEIQSWTVRSLEQTVAGNHQKHDPGFLRSHRASNRWPITWD